MKRVSFKVAKALKEAGYPQENCDEYLNKYGAIDFYLGHNTARPTYLEAWLWLCREKRMLLSIQEFCGEWNVYSPQAHGHIAEHYADPEEAIINAIDHLVDNNLIK